MKKIGITGSIASGKTTASKILSQRKGPLFSADNIVKKLYSKKSFQKLLTKKFHIHKDQGFIFSNDLSQKELSDFLMDRLKY